MLTRLRAICVETFAQAEEESVEHVRRHRGEVDGRVMVVCVLAALVPTMIRYFGGARGPVWWAGAAILFYFIAPIALIKLCFKENLSDHGLRFSGAFRDAGLYPAAFLAMVPAIVLASGMTSFQAQYPFYIPAPGEGLLPKMLLWETLYLAQFFAAEFFHRGLLVHGLKKRFGFYAVFAAAVPYCLIHFGKPLPETLGSIVAGVVLGILSLRNRSIVPGAALHCGVAAAMDLSALWRKGLL